VSSLRDARHSFAGDGTFLHEVVRRASRPTLQSVCITAPSGAFCFWDEWSRRRSWGHRGSRDRAPRWRLEHLNSTAPTGQTLARDWRHWPGLARKRAASRAPRRGHRGLTSTNPWLSTRRSGPHVAAHHAVAIGENAAPAFRCRRCPTTVMGGGHGQELPSCVSQSRIELNPDVIDARMKLMAICTALIGKCSCRRQHFGPL